MSETKKYEQITIREEEKTNSSVVVQAVAISEIYEAMSNFERGPALFFVMGGDRLSCCEQGILLKENGVAVGAATISLQGESRDGTPTIVGIYVNPDKRGKGYAGKLLNAAIDRCQELGLKKVRIDIESEHIKRIIDKLPEEKRKYLDVHDCGFYGIDGLK